MNFEKKKRQAMVRSDQIISDQVSMIDGRQSTAFLRNNGYPNEQPAQQPGFTLLAGCLRPADSAVKELKIDKAASNTINRSHHSLATAACWPMRRVYLHRPRLC